MRVAPTNSGPATVHRNVRVLGNEFHQPPPPPASASASANLSANPTAATTAAAAAAAATAAAAAAAVVDAKALAGLVLADNTVFTQDRSLGPAQLLALSNCSGVAASNNTIVLV